MPSLNMGSSYPLTEDEINTRVAKNRIGNYAYGYLNEQGTFIVKYVGRSDTDLHERIMHGIQEFKNNPRLKYERFKFSYATSKEEAYLKECKNFHDFGGQKGYLNNKIHPDAPEGIILECPFCNKM